MAENAEKVAKTAKAAKGDKKREAVLPYPFLSVVYKVFPRYTHRNEKDCLAHKKQVINNSLVVSLGHICGVVIFGLDNLFGLILTWILRRG